MKKYTKLTKQKVIEYIQYEYSQWMNTQDYWIDVFDPYEKLPFGFDVNIFLEPTGSRYMYIYKVTVNEVTGDRETNTIFPIYTFELTKEDIKKIEEKNYV